jgi:Spy/CpxP family protein refolding chaperone
MKKLSLIAALALGGLLACCTLATAQDANKDATPKKKRGFSVEQQMERMTTELSLTDEQKPKVKAVLEDASKKRQEIFSDSSLDRQQQREKMQPIMEEQNKKMKEILTSDQYDKYEKMMQDMRKKGQKKKSE